MANPLHNKQVAPRRGGKGGPVATNTRREGASVPVGVYDSTGSGHGTGRADKTASASLSESGWKGDEFNEEFRRQG